MLSKSEIKYIQSLGHKKFRDEYGVFIAEGPRLVNELCMEALKDIRKVYGVTAFFEEYSGLRALLKEKAVEISETELSRISQLTTPNKALAVLGKFLIERNLKITGKYGLALDNIQDPGNLGTIIRTADWYGIKEIFCSKDCADLYNPKVVQATMGSISRVTVFYTDLAAFFKGSSLQVCAAVLDGTAVSNVHLPEGSVLLIGNESKGVSEDLLTFAQTRITIPRVGKAESLNASVATGILLHHFCTA